MAHPPSPLAMVRCEVREDRCDRALNIRATICEIEIRSPYIRRAL